MTKIKNANANTQTIKNAFKCVTVFMLRALCCSCMKIKNTSNTINMCKILINTCIDCSVIVSKKIMPCPASEGVNLCVSNVADTHKIVEKDRYGVVTVDVSKFMAKDVVTNRFFNHKCE